VYPDKKSGAPRAGNDVKVALHIDFLGLKHASAAFTQVSYSQKLFPMRVEGIVKARDGERFVIALKLLAALFPSFFFGDERTTMGMRRNFSSPSLFQFSFSMLPKDDRSSTKARGKKFNWRFLSIDPLNII
jgi:hypothetical protein